MKEIIQKAKEYLRYCEYGVIAEDDTIPTIMAHFALTYQINRKCTCEDSMGWTMEKRCNICGRVVEEVSDHIPDAGEKVEKDG
jgi:hypothetical protein